jgi:hypothetical protein
LSVQDLIYKYFSRSYPGVVVLPALSQPELHAAIKHSVTAVVNTSVSEGMAACILEVRIFFITPKYFNK